MVAQTKYRAALAELHRRWLVLIGQSLVETGDRAAIHFIVLSVPADHLDDGGFLTIGIGIRGLAAD